MLKPPILRLEFGPFFFRRMNNLRFGLSSDGFRLFYRDLPFNQPFDCFQVWHFFRIAKRNRRPAGAGSGGSADPVNVRFRLIRQIVIHHVGDPIDVDPA